VKNIYFIFILGGQRQAPLHSPLLFWGCRLGLTPWYTPPCSRVPVSNGRCAEPCERLPRQRIIGPWVQYTSVRKVNHAACVMAAISANCWINVLLYVVRMHCRIAPSCVLRLTFWDSIPLSTNNNTLIQPTGTKMAAESTSVERLSLLYRHVHTGSWDGWSDVKAINTTRWQLYVGGQQQQQQPSSSQLSSSSLISGFVGCLSHLYVDDLTLQLVKAADDLPGSVQFSLVSVTLSLKPNIFTGGLVSSRGVSVTITITANVCMHPPPTALDGSASQTEKQV